MTDSRLKRLRKLLRDLNLFENESSDAQSIHHEKLATRIYILALIGLLITAGIVAAFSLRIVYKIDHLPSQSKFTHLVQNYANTLKCPCTSSIIAYETFVSAHVQFHQVCSSEFVSQAWIDSTYVPRNMILSLPTNDIRFTLSFFWQVIAGLCRISNQTSIDTLTNFGKSTIFSPTAVSEELIQIQAREALNNSINTAQVVLIRNLLTNQRIITGNQLMSGLATNVYVDFTASDNGVRSTPLILLRNSDNCSCLTVDGCPRPAMINNTQGRLTSVPGMVVDCLIVDATLASTLECYYDHTCISLLHEQLAADVEPLSTSSNKYFSSNWTIQTLLNTLRIDELSVDVVFNSFYSQCNLAYCSYTYMHRFDVLYIITTIIGIFGGLSFALRLTVPNIVKFVVRCKNRSPANDNSAAQEMPFNLRRCKLGDLLLKNCFSTQRDTQSEGVGGGEEMIDTFTHISPSRILVPGIMD
jgi:hypothetical protein